RGRRTWGARSRRPPLIHRGATARLRVAARHRGAGLALEPPGPFAHRGATARLQAAGHHLGAGLALEPPGPPAAAAAPDAAEQATGALLPGALAHHPQPQLPAVVDGDLAQALAAHAGPFQRPTPAVPELVEDPLPLAEQGDRAGRVLD